MSGKSTKLIGIAVIFAAFLIAAFNSMSITSLSILDTDPGTYVIVVMLMLFAFIIFSAKSDVEFEINWKNVIYSIFVFAIYVVAFSFLRVSLSSAFLSYRIDALLFPLLLLCIVLLVFGGNGVRKLYPLVVYAAFASPLILMPLLSLNNAFAHVNTILIYWIIKGIGIQVSRAGLILTSAIGSNITISSTCVSLGTFVAFVLFLIPVAYLYYGKVRSRLYWVLSGIALILVLNFLRMLLIALVWLHYGLGGAISTFHIFAGQLIFYICIIIMVLLAGSYGLRVREKGDATPKRAKKSERAAKAVKPDYGKMLAIAAVALAIAVFAFVLNSNLKYALYAPATLFSSSVKGPAQGNALNSMILLSVEGSGNSIMVLNISNATDLFLLGNITANLNNSIYVMANVSPSASRGMNLPGYTPIGNSHSHLLRNGITVTAQMASSENNTFEINRFSVPYNVSGSWFMVNYLLFERINSTSVPTCDRTGADANAINGFESAIHGLVNGEGSTGSGFMCQSFNIALSISK